MKVITIGRGEDNDVMVPDGTASRHHLQIIKHDDGHYTLSDFGSTNGTFVNGVRVDGEIVLNNNDIVRIGNTTIPWRDYFSPENDAGLQEPYDSTPDNEDESVDYENSQNETIELESQPKSENSGSGCAVWPIIFIIIGSIILGLNM